MNGLRRFVTHLDEVSLTPLMLLVGGGAVALTRPLLEGHAEPFALLWRGFYILTFLVLLALVLKLVCRCSALTAAKGALPAAAVMLVPLVFPGRIPTLLSPSDPLAGLFSLYGPVGSGWGVGILLQTTLTALWAFFYISVKSRSPSRAVAGALLTLLLPAIVASVPLVIALPWGAESLSGPGLVHTTGARLLMLYAVAFGLAVLALSGREGLSTLLRTTGVRMLAPVLFVLLGFISAVTALGADYPLIFRNPFEYFAPFALALGMLLLVSEAPPCLLAGAGLVAAVSPVSLLFALPAALALKASRMEPLRFAGPVLYTLALVAALHLPYPYLTKSPFGAAPFALFWALAFAGGALDAAAQLSSRWLGSALALLAFAPLAMSAPHPPVFILAGASGLLSLAIVLLRLRPRTLLYIVLSGFVLPAGALVLANHSFVAPDRALPLLSDRASLYSLRGDSLAALYLYDQAHVAKALGPDGLSDYGFLVAKRGHALAAFSLYRQALMMEPENERAAFGATNSLILAKRPFEAVSWVQAAQARGVVSGRLLKTAGRALLYAGEATKAEAWFVRALWHGEETAWPYLADCAYWKDEEALRKYALARTSGDPAPAYLELMRLHLLYQDSAGARTYASALKEHYPEDPDVAALMQSEVK